MAKVWVLDTETKGTGATVVPLEHGRPRTARTTEPFFVKPGPAPPRPAPEPVPRAPRRFRVDDVLTRRTLADDVTTREAVALLRGQRSTVDVRVSVWDPGREEWRLLTLGEQGALWDAAHR